MEELFVFLLFSRGKTKALFPFVTKPLCNTAFLTKAVCYIPIAYVHFSKGEYVLFLSDMKRYQKKQQPSQVDRFRKCFIKCYRLPERVLHEQDSCSRSRRREPNTLGTFSAVA